MSGPGFTLFSALPEAGTCLMSTTSVFPLQAGTQFWDENLENELAEGRLSSTAFDRYIPVSFGCKI